MLNSTPTSIWVALIVAIVGPIFLEILRHFLHNNKKSFTQVADESVIITNTLSELKHKMGARRLFIMQYHNGGSFYSGNPRQKVSMTHESYNENTTHSILPNFQELPISYFSSMTLRLSLEGKLKQGNITDIQDHTFRIILKEDEVISHYAFAIKKKKLVWDKFLPKFKFVMIASVHVYLDENSNEVEAFDLMLMESKVEMIRKYLI